MTYAYVNLYSILFYSISVLFYQWRQVQTRGMHHADAAGS